jgi:thiosulfate dehydrogenase [quinone] large subunit
MPTDASPAGSARFDRAWAIAFARVVLGLIFFMAGTHKVFVQGPFEHARKWFLPFSDTFLPVWSLWAVGTAIPFVEFAAGALLLLGLRVREALLALGAVLVIVTFGHLLHDSLYAFHEHVIPRLALLVFVLAMPRGDDRFTLDHWWQSRTAR